MMGMRIAVIGAGAGGLTAARALREVGLTPVVYEASEEIGGLWVYRERGTGPAYRSLRTNTSKQVTAFSDFPFPDDLPEFPERAAVEAYLGRYADAFELRPLIRFGCSVRRLEPEAPAGWRLTIAEGHLESTDVFDAVVVCSGIFSKPFIPVIPGMEGFTGRALHSISYRVPEGFTGEPVLVVGIGSSAADIAADLIGHAAQVTLSTRRGAWIAPRFAGGRPLDHAGTRLALLRPRFDRRGKLVMEEYARREWPSPFEVWPRANVPFDPAGAPRVLSDDLLPCIRSGELCVRPGIERFEGPEVVFADGSRLRADSVIFATGYARDFPFLSPELQPWIGPDAGLYRLVFPPDHPTLPFIGVCRVHGPILPIVEMQARWAARVLTGAVSLPSSEEMRAEAARRWSRQLEAHDSPIRVSLLPYLDEIGSLIGVRPHLWRHPFLLRQLLTGPPVAAQYRLEGPNRWTGAAPALRTASRRKTPPA
jgi:dimethylaniline monooxygenase (N-oxide forming)